MTDKAKEIFDYIQQRCLWQTHSREWDRRNNIEGVMDRVKALLTNEEIINNTLLEKAYYADAKVLVSQLEEHIAWIKEAKNEEITSALDGAKDELFRVFIDKCLNGEIRWNFY